jgi:hypothetical protein
MRKANLDRLLARRPEGLFVKPFERGEIGPHLFRKACEFGLEGLVSTHRERPYRSGRQKHWIKAKNRKHPAMDRVTESYQLSLQLGGPTREDCGATHIGPHHFLSHRNGWTRTRNDSRQKSRFDKRAQDAPISARLAARSSHREPLCSLAAPLD